MNTADEGKLPSQGINNVQLMTKKLVVLLIIELIINFLINTSVQFNWEQYRFESNRLLLWKGLIEKHYLVIP